MISLAAFTDLFEQFTTQLSEKRMSGKHWGT